MGIPIDLSIVPDLEPLPCPAAAEAAHLPGLTLSAPELYVADLLAATAAGPQAVLAVPFRENRGDYTVIHFSVLPSHLPMPFHANLDFSECS